MNPTNEQLDKFLAEEVMGWHEGRIAEHPSNLLWWMNNKEIPIMPVHNWYPSTDVSQAIECAEKFCKDAYCLIEMKKYHRNINWWYVHIWNEVYPLETDADIDVEEDEEELSFAISIALWEAKGGE